MYEQLEFDMLFEAELNEDEKQLLEQLEEQAIEEHVGGKESEKYRPRTADEVRPKIIKTEKQIQELAEVIANRGWVRASNVENTRKIGRFRETRPEKNTGVEVFVRRRKIEEITGEQNSQEKLIKQGANVAKQTFCHKTKNDLQPCMDENDTGAKFLYGANISFAPAPAPAPINLYRSDDSDKVSAPVPDCSDLPILSHFHEFESLVSIQSKTDSLVIALDTEFVSCSDEIIRIPVSFQFSVIDGKHLIEFVFLVCHPDVQIELDFCLGFILDYLGLYSGVKGSDVIEYKTCYEFDGKKPLTHTFDYVDFKDACLDAKYKYVQGEFIQELIPRSYCKSRSERDYGLFHWGTKFDKVLPIPITVLCHFGRIDISGFSDYARHMRKCSDVQGGTITMKSYNICLECHSKDSYWSNRDRSRHRFYPVKLSFSDTMCHAPANKKKLSDLGAVVGVPKVSLEEIHPGMYYISHIHDLLNDDACTFMEYSGTDAVVTLLYASSLYGYNKKLPVTITSVTSKYLRSKIFSFLCVSNSSEFNAKYRGLVRVPHGSTESDGKIVKVYSYDGVSSDASLIQSFASNAYHGGYNVCSDVGDYSGVLTHDYDICSAYSSIMSTLPDIDWDNPISDEIVMRNLSLDDFRDSSGDLDLTKVGFFEIDSFKFPKNVSAPCLCCVVDGVPVFPRKSSKASGKIYASAQDVYLALSLGASVHCCRGYFCNLLRDDNGNISHSLRDGVVELLQDRAKAKKKYGKGSLEDLILKTMVNSFYGKIAQNVVDKRTWNAYYDRMEELGISSVTNPVSACLITSYIRCILLAAYNQIVPLGYKCYSDTTDGFISDISHHVLDSLDLFGFRDFLLSARKIIGDSDATSCFEVKHEQSDLLNFTTRGNVSLSPDGVCAHNSFVTGFDKDSLSDRKALSVQVLSRTSRCSYTKGCVPGLKEILNKRVVPVFVNETRHISMDFDLKRKPIRESMRTVHRVIDGVSYEIVNFSTEPYETIEEFLLYRVTAQACKVNGCLRTMRDWEIFYARLSSSTVSSSTKKRVERHIRNVNGSDNLSWKTLQSVIMGYRLGFWDIPYLNRDDLSVADKIAWINKFNTSGMPFTENTWKDCRKKNRIGQMLSEDILFELISTMQNYSEDAS